MNPAEQTISDLPRHPILRVTGLCKTYGTLRAVSNATFTVGEGEILGIIGPSGGGKTTLLRCLNALEAFQMGEVTYTGSETVRIGPDQSSSYVDGSASMSNSPHDILSAFRRHVGMVFQGFNLWEERTLLDNLILAPVVVSGEKRHAVVERAQILCEQFGIADKLRSKVWQLSGGQRQRAAILRALMMQPRILLLDEVTSALDPVLTVDLMATIRKLRERGITLLIVTHHLDFASSLCDRIMFLSGGTVVQIATPSTLRDRPASKQVSEFLETIRAAR